MLRTILVLAVCAFANPTDSLRILLLESKLAQAEAEKAREEREEAETRIANIEAEVRRLAAAQPLLDRKALWGAGDKVESSIWLQVIGAGLSVLAGIGAANDSPGLAVAGSIGGAALGIVGTIQLFGAGTELKRASTLDEAPPLSALRDTTSSPALFREGKSPGGPGSW